MDRSREQQLHSRDDSLHPTLRALSPDELLTLPIPGLRDLGSRLALATQATRPGSLLSLLLLRRVVRLRAVERVLLGSHLRLDL